MNILDSGISVYVITKSKTITQWELLYKIWFVSHSNTIYTQQTRTQVML